MKRMSLIPAPKPKAPAVRSKVKIQDGVVWLYERDTRRGYEIQPQVSFEENRETIRLWEIMFKPAHFRTRQWNRSLDSFEDPPEKVYLVEELQDDGLWIAEQRTFKRFDQADELAKFWSKTGDQKQHRAQLYIPAPLYKKTEPDEVKRNEYY